jgi:hypothetical protein
MSADPAAIESAPGTVRIQAATRNHFFLGMTLVMAAVVLAGFMPTLFGRAAFNVPKMPGYLYLHGLLLTAWFALLVTQALLANNRNLALHRRLGWAALAFLVLIPVAGMGAQLAMPARLRELGMLAAMTGLVQTIFWLNLFSVLQFVGFAGFALWLRQRSDTHKRLMLFASIGILMPAAARLSRWPIFGNTASDLAQPSSTGLDVGFALGTMAMLIAAIVVNDLRTMRRVHRVTVIGAVVVVGMALLVPVFGNSEWGKAVVWAVS